MCAMCSSGSLGILSAPQGGCSSISQSVAGNVTPPKRLCTLGVYAGYSLPIKMSCFYGFTDRQISFCNLSTSAQGGLTTCSCSCIQSVNSMVGGQCLSVTLCGNLSTVGQGASSCAYFIVKCNGTQVYCCAAAANSCVSNICYLTPDAYGYCLHLVLCAVTTSCACTNCATAYGCISSVSPVSGSFSVGSPNTCLMCTG